MMQEQKVYIGETENLMERTLKLCVFKETLYNHSSTNLIPMIVFP